nr:MAG TPA: hypothetical protein [Bacteriophage sp.]
MSVFIQLYIEYKKLYIRLFECKITQYCVCDKIFYTIFRT